VSATSSGNWCQKHGTTNMTTGGCVQCAAERGATEAKHATGDARAQLWARVYAAEFEVFRTRAPHLLNTCREAAREAADAAVRDFDEHYLGGKR